ncbi:hypothetical protein BC628DRAFT_1527526 [Trametes gibbosa]|nr:hypothetical protein BC628DRAFT_1527526 [Trametes gibbosa]
MATPSSAATTPSPRPRYLHSPGDASSSAAMLNGTPSHSGDDRERVVQKLRTQAELNKVCNCAPSHQFSAPSLSGGSGNIANRVRFSPIQLALNLRARLSYANFKVKTNSTNNTLLDLDSQLHTAAKHAATGRTPTKPSSSNYFGNPGSPGPAGQSSRSAARRGPMAPPPPVTASAAQSLFSSLLAPPPAKRARTIHNPHDPPLAASEKAVEHTRSPHRPTKVAHTPDSHAKSKSRKGTKDKAGAPSSAKGKGKARQRVTAEGSFEPASDALGEGDIDVEAAKTLTHFLLAHRPSVSGTAGSPRSSISAGSDAGSTQSFPHYTQSATRMGSSSSVQESPFVPHNAQSTATPPHSPALSQPSPALSHAMSSHAMGYRQVAHQGSNLRPEGGSTPKMTPRERVGSAEDTDAAGMLLLMATSPSPVRPSTNRDRDARDAAAFHALRGGGSGLKGRVLFPSHGGEDGRGGNGHSRTLSREMSGSFASISSATTEPASPRIVPARRAVEHMKASSSSSQGRPAGGGGRLDVLMPMLPTITPPTPTDQISSQLPPHVPSSPHQAVARRSAQSIPGAGDVDHKPPIQPLTPNASFSLSDYVNVSPSPGANLQSRQPSNASMPMGRRLFEEHPAPNGSPGRRPRRPPPSSPSPSQKSGLSAGVDHV